MAALDEWKDLARPPRRQTSSLRNLNWRVPPGEPSLVGCRSLALSVSCFLKILFIYFFSVLGQVVTAVCFLGSRSACRIKWQVQRRRWLCGILSHKINHSVFLLLNCIRCGPLRCVQSHARGLSFCHGRLNCLQNIIRDWPTVKSRSGTRVKSWLTYVLRSAKAVTSCVVTVWHLGVFFTSQLLCVLGR